MPLQMLHETAAVLAPAGSALIVAPWPATSAPVDPQALEHFGSLQATVRSIRNARAEYGVELARKVPATLQVASPELR